MPATTMRAALLSGAAAAAVAAAAVAPPAFAQTAVETASETIIVTATKRAGGVDVQDAPIAMTAYDADQLDARFVRDLEDLSFSMPNVQLNDVGTAKGIANFSIRGLGINSSIPSVDPAVGVFVDGMYLGITAGVVLDTFDLDGVEVLRGPQGLLFGRNVTGGAVLLRTRAPSTDEYTADGKVAVESGLNGNGLNYYAMGSASGPIAGDALAARLSLYYNKDEGWFENLYDHDNFGEAETWIVRPSFSAKLGDNLDTILRLEHGDGRGDGPPAQNHAVFDRHDFDFSIDNEGYADQIWNQAINETNWRIGGATITNILGWRGYDSKTGNDIDSLPVSTFDARSLIDQEQWSDELRYSATWEDAVDVTAGLYYFNQNTAYTEERTLFRSLPPVLAATAAAMNQRVPGSGTALQASGGRVVGGGSQDHETAAAFSQFDLHLTDTFTLNVGVRYTYEEKEARIVSLTPSLLVPGCAIDVVEGCNAPNAFYDKEDWENTDGKLGFQYQPADAFQVYGFWTSGFRSGGYNFRVSSTVIPGFDQSPGPTDPESVDTLEAGVKLGDGGRYRLNAAVFHTEIQDMQRELNLPGLLGVAQFIRNTADATLEGFELEGQYTVLPSLLVTGFVGYTDGDYDVVTFDLSCNGEIGSPTCSPTGAVGPDDWSLSIPRVAPWTYGVGLVHDLPLGGLGSLTSRVDWSHRQKSSYTDNNLGYLDKADILDASFGYSPGSLDSLVISLYGRNLLNDVSHGGDTQLPNTQLTIPGFPFAGPFGGPGATFSPLNKGRVVGLEAQLKY